MSTAESSKRPFFPIVPRSFLMCCYWPNCIISHHRALKKRFSCRIPSLQEMLLEDQSLSQMQGEVLSEILMRSISSLVTLHPVALHRCLQWHLDPSLKYRMVQKRQFKNYSSVVNKLISSMWEEVVFRAFSPLPF